MCNDDLPSKQISQLCDGSTVLMESVHKVPQINQIIATKNLEGLNLITLLLEVLCWSTLFAYKFRNNSGILSSFDTISPILQQMVIIYLVVVYKEKPVLYYVVGTLVYLFFMVLVSSEIIAFEILTNFLIITIPLKWVAKLMQLNTIVRASNPEAVNALTYVLAFLVSVLKIVSLATSNKDAILLVNYGGSGILNLSILFTLYYKRKKYKTV